MNTVRRRTRARLSTGAPEPCPECPRYWDPDHGAYCARCFDALVDHVNQEIQARKAARSTRRPHTPDTPREALAAELRALGAYAYAVTTGTADTHSYPHLRRHLSAAQALITQFQE